MNINLAAILISVQIHVFYNKQIRTLMVCVCFFSSFKVVEYATVIIIIWEIM